MRRVIETIMNPKLVANDILKKFSGMDRILENVSTYYFENFLHLTERTVILDEIKQFMARVRLRELNFYREALKQISTCFHSSRATRSSLALLRQLTSNRS
jgi:hypothetical protein